VLAVLVCFVACKGNEAAPSVDSDATQLGEVEEAVPVDVSAVQRYDALPSHELPFRSTVKNLTRLAAQGSGPAACRLATEYQRCSRIQDQLASLQGTIAALETRPEGSRPVTSVSVEALNRQSKILLEQATHCEGVELPSPSQRVGLWRQAAKSGIDAAAVVYASGSAFGPRDTLSVLDELRVYKSDAVAIATHAAKSGNAEAVLLLANAHNPLERAAIRTSLLSQLVDEDPLEALILYRMYLSQLESAKPSERERLDALATRISKLERTLTPAQLNEANVEVAQRKGTWAPLSFETNLAARPAPEFTEVMNANELCKERAK
jgi:hypothetical protein